MKKPIYLTENRFFYNIARVEYRNGNISEGELKLKQKLWEDELPSLEGMDPYDPVCQAIVQNEKWTADQLGQDGYNFCKAMKIAHREIIGTILVEFTHAWYKRDDSPPSVSEAISWKDRVIKTNPEIQKVIFIQNWRIFKS